VSDASAVAVTIFHSARRAMTSKGPRGPDKDFDPERHHYFVEPRYLEDLKVGEKFYMPSRTLTDGMFAAFQVVSGDQHPSHYDIEFCRARNQRELLAHGLHTVALTTPGASIFPFMVGGTILGLIEQSSQFYKGMFRGDTVYPAIEIVELIPQKTTGILVLRSTVHNQRGELIMEGQQRYLVRSRAGRDKTNWAS
jgi:acyl dehydratase